jgi:hypothetical protein
VGSGTGKLGSGTGKVELGLGDADGELVGDGAGLGLLVGLLVELELGLAATGLGVMQVHGCTPTVSVGRGLGWMVTLGPTTGTQVAVQAAGVRSALARSPTSDNTVTDAWATARAAAGMAGSSDTSACCWVVAK